MEGLEQIKEGREGGGGTRGASPLETAMTTGKRLPPLIVVYRTMQVKVFAVFCPFAPLPSCETSLSKSAVEGKMRIPGNFQVFHNFPMVSSMWERNKN